MSQYLYLALASTSVDPTLVSNFPSIYSPIYFENLQTCHFLRENISVAKFYGKLTTSFQVWNFCSRFGPHDLNNICNTQQCLDSRQALLQAKNILNICGMINFISLFNIFLFPYICKQFIIIVREFKNRLKQNLGCIVQYY